MDHFNTLRIIWIALMAGLASYAAVAIGIVLGGMGLGALPPSVMPYVAAGAVALMMAGLGVRRRGVSAIPRDASESARFERYQVATIAGLALIEGGGLLVITASLVADTPWWALAGGGAGVWTMWMARPRREEVEIRPPRA